MKTKDFIKMLQEADPDGEGYIRMSDGIPKFAISKEGYWDGPYTYIDNDGNYVCSIKGYKIDIYNIDIYDFVEEQIEKNKNVSWNEIKDKFKFDLGLPNGKNNQILNDAKKAFDDIKEIYNEIYNDYLNKLEKDVNNGWKWFQNKIDNSWKVYNENNEIDNIRNHMIEIIESSGLWYKIDNNLIEDYYQWIYKK